jgi:hypothetical protein
MTTCPRCASDVRPEWKFCVMCGERRAVTARSTGEPINRTSAVVLIAASATGAVIVGGVAVLATALV